MLRVLFTLLFCCSLTSVCHAQTINWLTNDFAPYYILNGKYQGQGRDETIIKLLEDQLPHIKFNRVVVPASKLIQTLSDKTNDACVLSLYKNENRKQQMVFTQESSTVGLSPSVALHKRLANALSLKNDAEVSLYDLLQEKKLTLGVSLSRSYGEAIDSIINSTPDVDIVIRPTRDSLASLTYMLNLKRIDILLGYPSEHFYLAKSMNFQDNLTQRPLTEAPALSYGFIGCTKTEQGIKNIALLNKHLKVIKQTDAYINALSKWLPEHLKPLLKTRMN
jgi:uncharacterized protein (TIGR02285 family)